MTAAKKFGVRYPWSTWFRGRQFRLKYGREFTCRPQSMSQLVYRAARTWHVEVTVVPSADGRELERAAWVHTNRCVRSLQVSTRGGRGGGTWGRKTGCRV